MTRKKSLPIAGKSLMPEILPNPNQARQQAGVSARERVRARLRQLLQLSEQAAALAAAASITACSDTHAGDQTTAGSAGLGTAAVGGVMSQAGHTGAGTGAGRGGMGVAGAAASGGMGGTGRPPSGGTAGYGVVDPLPPPSYVCSMVKIFTASAQWQDAQNVALSVQLAGATYGVALSSAMVPTAVTASISSASSPYAAKLQSGAWPPTTRVTLNFTCSGGGGTPSTAQATVWLDTSHPAGSGAVTVTMTAPGDQDAGL